TKYSLTPSSSLFLQFVDLSSCSLVVSFGALTPLVVSSGDTSLTVVCRFYSGHVHVPVSIRFIVGMKIFFGVARLTFSCLCDMGRWSSNVFEVPLSGGYVFHRSVTFSPLEDVRGLKTPVEANDVIVSCNRCLYLAVSLVKHVSSPLSLCLPLSYVFFLFVRLLIPFCILSK
ncbi:hypothetical protein CARUB_v10012476mg, partial [Capsella rubella]